MKFEEKKVVDELGRVKARLAKLEELEQNLIKRLKKQGCRTYQGVLFEANVFAQNKTLVDWESIAKTLVPVIPPRTIKRYTKMVPVVVCKVTARKTK